MNQYIKFIRHVLWACFFVTFLGLLIQYVVGWNQYMLGWLWGLLTMMVYLVLLGLHSKGLAYVKPHQAVAKARRLALIGAFVVIGLQIPGVKVESLFIAIVLIQPILYIVFWRLSK